jgi:3',5'-cyclic AMP phosphodiesterase CpdA
MIKFIHLSDLHISAPPIANPLAQYGVGGPSLPTVNSAGITNAMVDARLTYIDRHYPDHFLIVTGDITDNGLPEEYKEAERILRRFRGKIFVCPGNHDFGILGNFLTTNQALMFDTFASSLMVNSTSSAGEFLGSSTSYANKYSSVAKISKPGFTRVISVIGLDSNRPAAQEFAARGRIGDRQLDDLKKLLYMVQGERSRLVQIVCLHHHPVPLQHSNIEVALQLVDAEKFRNVVRGKVDLVLFGHKHFQTLGRQDGYQWLSSGASPKEARAREIIVGPHGITCRSVPIC